MRTPFRLTVPNWFGDPGPELLRPQAMVLPLWRRATELRRAAIWLAPASAARSYLLHARSARP